MTIKTKHKQYNYLTPVYSVFAGAIVLLLIVQVIVSNRLAIYGKQLSVIDSQIEQIDQENNDMNEKIASASSLLTIKEKSAKLGFVKNILPHFLSENMSVALQLH